MGLVASLGILRLPRRWIRGHITKTIHEVHIGLQPGADAEKVQRALGSLDGLEVKAIHTEKRNGQLGLRRIGVGCDNHVAASGYHALGRGRLPRLRRNTVGSLLRLRNGKRQQKGCGKGQSPKADGPISSPI